LDYGQLSAVVTKTNGFEEHIGLLYKNMVIRKTILEEFQDKVSALQKQVDATYSNEATKELVSLFKSSGFDFTVIAFFSNFKKNLESEYLFKVEDLDLIIATSLEKYAKNSGGGKMQMIWLGAVVCADACTISASNRFPIPDDANREKTTYISIQQSAYYLGCYDCCMSVCGQN